jgi:hypothetical protein
MLDNITFGLEVCADHGIGRLRKATPLAGDVFVQIQLIPSGRMIIFPASVATLKGGLVCNVDGATPQTTNTNSDAAGFHSELYSVLSPGQPPTLRDMREILPLTSVTASADLAEVQKVFWLPPDKEPNLVIYNVVNIPAPVVTTT